jgi:hypothetical protein
VRPSIDTEYELRIGTNYNNQVTAISSGISWATVESTDPNPPKGGNWALSSLVTLSANQTSNLAVGQPIRFDTISGDHTLQNYRVKVKGGQKAELIANLLCNFSGTSGYINTQWYNVTAGTLVGKPGSCVSVTVTGNYGAFAPAVTLETPIVDSEYELRVTAVAQITNIDAAFSSAQVHSTLPNASVTSQVIRKETVATNTTAWTVTLPVACKAIRIKLYCANGSSSSSGVSLSVNGVSSGHRQFTYSVNGGSPAAGEAANTVLFGTAANQNSDADISLSISGSETRGIVNNGNYAGTTDLAVVHQYMRIAQSADISTLTFTSDQTNGIGAGSYIIVERVDAELSQDLGWQSYTPTCYIDLTSATTVPNITPSVRYRVDGKTLFVQGTLNFTGAPTGATDLAISLPTGVNVVSLPVASKFPYAGHSAFAGGSGTWMGTVRLPGSTENSGRVSFRAQTSASGIAGVTTTTPFTWANGNQLEFDFFTEIQ